MGTEGMDGGHYWHDVETEWDYWDEKCGINYLLKKFNCLIFSHLRRDSNVKIRYTLIDCNT